MKLIRTIQTGVLAALIAFALPACNDKFLEIVPQTAIPFGEFWSTPTHVNEYLSGAYDALSSGAFMGNQAWMLSELMADNLAPDRVLLNGDWAAHYTRTADLFLGTTRGFMHDGGKVLARVNFIMDNIDKIEGLPETDKQRIVAECKFLRGVTHFELVRIFAQPYGYTPDNSHLGIPIHTRFGRDTVSRASVKQVYDQIIADLTDASNNLPDQNGVYATSLAAKGYLAKAYFQMNDFAKAYEHASSVIESGRFQLDSTLNRRFAREASPEAVFYLYSSVRDNAGGGLWSIYRQNPANENNADATLSFEYVQVAATNPADKRGKEWVKAAGNFYYCSKIADPAPGEQPVTQVPLVHLTELKLIRAESAAELNQNLPQAAADLSDIRLRAGLSAVPAGTLAVQLIQIARQERHIEMVIEGNRLHELKRQAVRGDANLQIRGIRWDCPGLVAQFPDNELQGNPRLKPNPTPGPNGC